MEGRSFTAFLAENNLALILLLITDFLSIGKDKSKLREWSILPHRALANANPEERL